MSNVIGNKKLALLMPLAILIVIVLLIIGPVQAGFTNDACEFGEILGKVMKCANTTTNYNGEIDTESQITAYMSDQKAVNYPWKGYSKSGWDIYQISSSKGSSPLLGGSGFVFCPQTAKRYLYIHMEPPVGYNPVSAKTLDSFGAGTVLDSQTIFFDTFNLQPRAYEIRFDIVPRMGCGPAPNYAHVKAPAATDDNSGDSPNYAHERAPPAADDNSVPESDIGSKPFALSDDKTEEVDISGYTESEAGPVTDISKLSCNEEGLTRCNGLCVDLQIDPGHCGSCGTRCMSPLACVNGSCTGRAPGIHIGDWFNSILSLPQTIISMIQISPVRNPGTHDAMQEDAIEVLQDPAVEKEGDSMQVVVLPDSNVQPAEIVQVNDNIGPEIVIQDTGVPVVQVRMIENPEVTPSSTLPPVVVMKVPTTGIVHQPDIVSPVNIPCPTGYYKCGGLCVDIMNDVSNCGSCNVTCMSGATCENGKCVARMVTTQPTVISGAGRLRL
jgi:hypothetical protein